MTHRLLVVGGDAGGMAAAASARRHGADFEIVALEQGRYTSYSACGIPYVVSGDVWALEELVVRTPQQFRDQLRIDVRTGHRATAVDLDRRSVEVRNLAQDRTYHLGFDLLHIATGARPRRPPIPGIDGSHVFGVQTLDDAARLLATIKSGQCEQVAVIGGGYIGLELAEAFVKRQSTVTVVEERDEVMGTLD